MTTTIKNILDLAWLGAENDHSGENHFDLSATLIELVEIAAKLAAQKQIKLTSEVDPGVLITGREDKINRAILNIIDNAVKYTPRNKTVSILLRKKPTKAIIEIKDTGIGIYENELPHVFERFYRGSKTAKTFGSGLGLAIAQGIIKAHRGDIAISSKVGKGTAAVITLPLAHITS